MELDKKYIAYKQIISQVVICAMGRKGQRKRDKECHREVTVAVAILYMVVREGRSLYLWSEQREQPVQRF